MTSQQAYKAYIRGCLRIMRATALTQGDSDLVRHCDEAEAGDLEWQSYCVTVYEMTRTPKEAK